MAYLGVKPAGITSATEAEIAGDLTVDTNTLKVDAANNRVGIGTTSPGAILQVDRASSNFIRFADSGSLTGLIGLDDGATLVSGGTDGDMVIRAETSGKGVVFAGNAATRFGMIDADGLKFNTDTAAANALSDYEEGTWTPVDVSPASLSITVQSAFYRKIGSLVAVQAYVVYPTTSNTNNATLGGLPFAGISGAGSYGAFAVGYSDYSTMFQILKLASGSTTLDFRVAGGQNVLNSNFSAKSIIFSGVYVSA
tara:strand:- start:297 stop:1055 length:759 start_codon:yes stop_codon:yes gene_type:complete